MLFKGLHMKKILIITLVSAFIVGYAVAMESEVPREQTISCLSNRASSVGQQESNFSSLKYFVLIGGAYALADYFEKVPNFLSVRHGIRLLRSKKEEDLSLQDVYNRL